jgi:hypothetical protein
MLRYLLICVVLAFVHCAEAQVKSPVVKVHAFRREIVPGAKMEDDSNREKTYRYFLYLETKTGASYTVKDVWVNGVKQQFTTAVRKSPVKMEHPVIYSEQEKNIAVPATKNKITEVLIEGDKENKRDESNSTAINNAALVRIVYQGKSFQVSIKAFKEREPMFMQ